AAVALALDAVPNIPWPAGVVGAALFAAAAGVRRVQYAAERRTARRVADERILRGHGVPFWREDDLTSTRARAARRRQIERIVRSTSVDRLPSASPLNRTEVRRSAALLDALAARLDDDRPVSPRGVLYVDQLLGDPASPLYGEHADLLPRAITRVLGALDE
ncbi:MAG TPA: hypothetical protein VGN06_01270, partial [Gaiellaceae bacterium]